MIALRAAALLLAVAALAASEGEVPRLDFSCRAQPASIAVASITELLGHRQELADDLIDAGLGARPIHLELVAADAEAAAQALAHALDCWWTPRAAGGATYSRAAILPARGPLSVRTWTSRLRGHPQLEDQVRALMAPWLGPDCGLVLFAPLGRWTATLDPAGQAELEGLLVRIERPAAAVPPLVPHPHQPPAHLRLERALAAEGPEALTRELAATLGRSVALGPHRLPGRRFELHPAPLHELPLQLSAQGLDAAWIGGVLCLGGRPEEGLHPALRRRWALIPVRHLAQDAIALAALAARLEREAAPAWWDQPGAGILSLDEHGMLLVAADANALAAVMHQLERIDRAGGIGR